MRHSRRNEQRTHLFEPSHDIAPIFLAGVPLNVEARKVAVSQVSIVHFKVLVCTTGCERSPESCEFDLVISMQLEIAKRLNTTVHFSLFLQIVLRDEIGCHRTGGDELSKRAGGGLGFVKLKGLGKSWPRGCHPWHFVRWCRVQTRHLCHLQICFDRCKSSFNT